MLRFIKREQPDLKTLISDISRASSAAYSRIEEFGKSNPYLNLKNEGLPLAELATRKSISTMKTRLLLHNKGAEFELQLLLSQNEALVYGGISPRSWRPAKQILNGRSSFGKLPIACCSLTDASWTCCCAL